MSIIITIISALAFMGAILISRSKPKTKKQYTFNVIHKKAYLWNNVAAAGAFFLIFSASLLLVPKFPTKAIIPMAFNASAMILFSLWKTVTWIRKIGQEIEEEIPGGSHKTNKKITL